MPSLGNWPNEKAVSGLPTFIMILGTLCYERASWQATSDQLLAALPDLAHSSLHRKQASYIFYQFIPNHTFHSGPTADPPQFGWLLYITCYSCLHAGVHRAMNQWIEEYRRSDRAIALSQALRTSRLFQVGLLELQLTFVDVARVAFRARDCHLVTCHGQTCGSFYAPFFTLSVASPQPTIAGMPSSRAIMAAWQVRPPRLVMIAPAFFLSGSPLPSCSAWQERSLESWWAPSRDRSCRQLALHPARTRSSDRCWWGCSPVNWSQGNLNFAAPTSPLPMRLPTARPSATFSPPVRSAALLEAWSNAHVCGMLPPFSNILYSSMTPTFFWEATVSGLACTMYSLPSSPSLAHSMSCRGSLHVSGACESFPRPWAGHSASRSSRPSRPNPWPLGQTQTSCSAPPHWCPRSLSHHQPRPAQLYGDSEPCRSSSRAWIPWFVKWWNSFLQQGSAWRRTSQVTHKRFTRSHSISFEFIWWPQLWAPLIGVHGATHDSLTQAISRGHEDDVLEAALRV